VLKPPRSLHGSVKRILEFIVALWRLAQIAWSWSMHALERLSPPSATSVSMRQLAPKCSEE
jgi:hypothetical protein